MDKTVNKYGRSLIYLCASNNLCILNGRIQGDRFGKFTCHKSNGASVVDYAILSNTLLRKVVYFSVLPLSFLSCHCPISFAIKTNKFFLDTNKSCKFLESKPSTFIWERVKKEHYSLLLNNIETIKEANSYIDDILGINFHLNQLIMLQSLSQELYVRMLLSVLRLKDAQGKKQNQTLM